MLAYNYTTRECTRAKCATCKVMWNNHYLVRGVCIKCREREMRRTVL